MDAESVAFAHALRAAMGDQERSWDADGVDDDDHPLGRYLTIISNEDRTKLIAAPDALFTFVTENYAPLFEITSVIDAKWT